MINSPDDDRPARSRIWGSILTVAAGLAIVGLAWSTIRYRDMYVETLDRLRSTEFRRRTLEEDASNFRNLRPDSAAAMLQIVPTLTLAEVASLQNKGLWNPYDDIAHDLMNHPELMSPDDAEPGGPPLPARENICVLGPDRVLAHFEHDGNQQRILLSYSVSDNGAISWQVLETVAVE